MSDMESVIEHLRFINVWAAVGKDPKYNGIDPKSCEKVQAWTRDAIEALKEKEPVTPISVGHTCWLYTCECGNYFTHKAKYCEKCGRLVRWDE